MKTSVIGGKAFPQESGILRIGCWKLESGRQKIGGRKPVALSLKRAGFAIAAFPAVAAASAEAAGCGSRKRSSPRAGSNLTPSQSIVGEVRGRIRIRGL